MAIGAREPGIELGDALMPARDLGRHDARAKQRQGAREPRAVTLQVLEQRAAQTARGRIETLSRQREESVGPGERARECGYMPAAGLDRARDAAQEALLQRQQRL